MRSLAYLLVHRVKNRFLTMVKNPGSLIGMLAMVGLLGFVIFTGDHGAQATGTFRSINELYALAFVLYAFLFVTLAKNGLNKGTSLFSMADVNLLFSSPISNRRILLYGLVQQMGTSLLMGLFLLFQYSWMRQAYGINPMFLVALVLGYAVTVFCGQLTAMVIYVYTAGKERRKRGIMAALVITCVAAVAYLLVRAYFGQADLLGTLTTAALGLPLSLFPVAGWARELMVGIATGQWLLAAGMLALVVLYVAAVTWVMTSSQADYYEDVLQATERSHSAIVAKREGKGAETLPDNVKVGKQGLGAGLGASAFFYKQRLESRRARRILFDPMTMIFLATNIVFAFFIRSEGLLPVLIFVTFMQVFNVSTGRWVRELLLPYIYMVPDSPFRKLLYNLLETFWLLLLEAIVLAIGLALVLQLSILEAAAFVVVRLSYGILFTACMLLIERLFSWLTIKWLSMMLMMVGMMIVSAPGIAAAVYVAMTFPALPGNLVMTLVPAVVNFLVGLLMIYASRNVLQVAEMNNV